MNSKQSPKSRVLDALEAVWRDFLEEHGVEFSGESDQGNCPLHEDGSPSFSVFDGPDGLRRWKCHAGCGGGNLIDFHMARTGLEFGDALRDLADRFGLESPQTREGSEPTAEYVYEDTDGTPLFRVSRFDGPKGKRFVQSRADGNGGWVTGKGCMKGVERVPFHLPRWKDSGTVLLVEGEKCVLAVEGLGLPAATTAGGANGWRREYAPFFEGKRVFLLPDHDLAGRGYTDAAARDLAGVAKGIRLLELPDLGESEDVADWIRRGGTRDQLVELLRDAPTYPTDNRRTITVSAELSEMVEAAQSALLAESPLRIFSRAENLVRVIRAEPPQAGKTPTVRRPAGLPVIAPVDIDWLMERSAATAVWVRLLKKGERHVLPSRQAIRSLLSRGSWPFPALVAVTGHPVLRPDGTILQTSGFDGASGVHLAGGQREWHIPTSPTPEEVREAILTLSEPFSQFSFVDDADHAAAVAAVLSIVARPAIDGPVPLFGITAPTPGEGKSLLADALCIAASGRPPSKISWTPERAEQRKIITSICMEGLPVVLIDNVEGLLGSPVLSLLLTATEFRDRLLGKNRTVSSPHRTVWFATGNNLAYSGDTFRRVIPIHLDGKTEKPEEREFRIPNLRAWMEERWFRICAAALTILRGYHVAGRPAHGGPRIGSFEAWDDLVRGAVCWSLEADPAAGRERVRMEADENLELMRSVFAAWIEAYPDGGFRTVRELIADREDGDPLLEAFRSVDAKAKDRPRARNVGSKLRKWKGRIADGLRLEQSTEKARDGALWQVVRCDSATSATLSPTPVKSESEEEEEKERKECWGELGNDSRDSPQSHGDDVLSIGEAVEYLNAAQGAGS